jgi:hypothetical protein
MLHHAANLCRPAAVAALGGMLLAQARSNISALRLSLFLSMGMMI